MKAKRQTLRRSLFALAAGLSFSSVAPAQSVDMIITSEIPVSVNPSPYIIQFIDEVRKRTNGAINGKYFDSSQLYNDRDGLAALGTGSVQMVWPVTSRLEALDARIGLASLPFALSATEMGNKCFADVGGHIAVEKFEVLSKSFVESNEGQCVTFRYEFRDHVSYAENWLSIGVSSVVPTNQFVGERRVDSKGEICRF